MKNSNTLYARVLPLIGGLALAPGALAGAPACLETHHDDYEDGVLTPGFTQLGSCGTVSEAGGVLTLTPCGAGSSSTVFRQVAGASVLCGDFDLSVDYALSNFTVPAAAHRWAGLKIHRASDSVILCGIERFVTAGAPCAPGNSAYKAFGTSTASCDSEHAATTDTAGRFRITRTGVTFTLQYRAGGAWQTLHTVDQTAEDVLLSFSTGTVEPTAHAISFDELTIGTQACCLDIKCLMLSPTDCVDLGGVPAGPDANCLGDVCLVGGCCTDSNCTQVIEPACVAGGGTFLGVGVRCVDDACNLLDCRPESDFGQAFDQDAFGLTPSGSRAAIRVPPGPVTIDRVRTWVVFQTEDGQACPPPDPLVIRLTMILDDAGTVSQPLRGYLFTITGPTPAATGLIDPVSGADVYRIELDLQPLFVQVSDSPDIEVASRATLDGCWVSVDGISGGACVMRQVVDPTVESSYVLLDAFDRPTVVTGAPALCLESTELGACCLETGECRFTTAAECSAEVGSYGGVGSTCFEDGLTFWPYLRSTTIEPFAPIFDHQLTESTIEIAENAVIGRLVVSLQIAHTFVGDLIIDLTHGDTSIQLVPAPTSCGADDYDGIVLADSGTAGLIQHQCTQGLSSPPFYVPLVLLHPFIGTDAAGEWTLSILDAFGGDEGTLESWSISYEEGTPHCTPAAPCCLPDDMCIVVTADGCAALGGMSHRNAAGCDFIGGCPEIEPADVDGDGLIIVDDLIAIIVAWGPCAPASLCPEDIDGNGEVGVDDLVAVITGWSP